MMRNEKRTNSNNDNNQHLGINNKGAIAKHSSVLHAADANRNHVLQAIASPVQPPVTSNTIPGVMTTNEQLQENVLNATSPVLPTTSPAPISGIDKMQPTEQLQEQPITNPISPVTVQHDTVEPAEIQPQAPAIEVSAPELDQAMTVNARFENAIVTNNLDEVRSMIEQGFDPNVMLSDGLTAIISAVKNRQTDMTMCLLSFLEPFNISGSNTPGHTLDLNAKDVNGATLIFYVVGYQMDSFLEYLLLFGSNPNVQTHVGKTALMFAAYKHNTSIVKLLIKYGADLRLKTSSDQTALSIALETKANSELIDLLYELTPKNLADSSGCLIQHYAAIHNNVQLLKRMHNERFSMEVRDNYGRTPLMVAAYFGNLEAVNELIALHVDVNALQPHYWNSALHFATQNKHIPVIRSLLSANANYFVMNVNGKSPLNMVIQSVDLELFNTFAEHFSRRNEVILDVELFDSNQTGSMATLTYGYDRSRVAAGLPSTAPVDNFEEEFKQTGEYVDNMMKFSQ